MTLRVALHQTPALRTKTGIGHYVAELRDALQTLGGDVEVRGLPSGVIASACQWAAPLIASSKTVPSGPRSRPNSYLRNRLRAALSVGAATAQRAYFWNVQRQLTRENFDVYHEPNFRALDTDLPTVLTLHDLSVLLMPECHPRSRVESIEKHLPEALRRSSQILTLSQTVREEIIRVLGYPAERVTAAYLAVRDSLRPLPESETRKTLAALGLPPRYLLYVGTLEPRKNLLNLMRAYCQITESRRRDCPLLLVGGWGWNVAPIAEYFESHARHKGVIHLGYLAEEHLCAVYNGARALVFPSIYEGFGLPPLEMMACGGASLVSKAGVLVELFGKRCPTIDAEDVFGWSAAMERIMHDDDWLRELRKDVRSYAGTFTWRRCAEISADVYRRAAGATRIAKAA